MSDRAHLPSIFGNHRSSFDPFAALQHQVDRLFDDYNGLRAPNDGAAMLSPALDLKENEDSFDITAELPGVTKKDLDVRLTNDQIILKGEKKVERNEKKDDYHMVERRFGSFQRVLGFPCEVDNSKVEASFKDGVLKIHVPKAPEAKSREKKISVS